MSVHRPARPAEPIAVGRFAARKQKPLTMAVGGVSAAGRLQWPRTDRDYSTLRRGSQAETRYDRAQGFGKSLGSRTARSSNQVSPAPVIRAVKNESARDELQTLFFFDTFDGPRSKGDDPPQLLLDMFVSADVVKVRIGYLYFVTC